MITITASIVTPFLIVLSGSGLHTWLGLPDHSRAWFIASSVILGLAIAGFVGPIASMIGIPVPATTLSVMMVFTIAGLLRLWKEAPHHA